MHAGLLKASGMVVELGMARWEKEMRLCFGVLGLGTSSHVTLSLLN